MNEYIGVIHIHSVFSDGTGTIPEIAAIANELGLDFLMITDHNTLRGKEEGYEKFYGNTLAIIGCEINDENNKNHYLAFGIDEAFSTRLGAKTYVKKVNEYGGIGFIAHPHEKRDSMKEHPPYPWTDWDIDNFTGIEIWNHMSEWMENLTEQNKYQSFLHPLKTIKSPPLETIRVWDNLNKKRMVVGIGGVDAHAHKVNLLGFFEVEVFPYKVLFKSIRNHILTSEKIEVGTSPSSISNAVRIILEALQQGRVFISNSYHGDAAGFRFFADNDEKIFQMGESVTFERNKIFIKAEIPAKNGELRLVRNGKVIFSAYSDKLNYKVTEKGAYRLEVYTNGKAWIFSNHIRIGKN